MLCLPLQGIINVKRDWPYNIMRLNLDNGYNTILLIFSEYKGAFSTILWAKQHWNSNFLTYTAKSALQSSKNKIKVSNLQFLLWNRLLTHNPEYECKMVSNLRIALSYFLYFERPAQSNHIKFKTKQFLKGTEWTKANSKYPKKSWGCY